MNDLTVKNEEFVWVRDPQQDMIGPSIGTLLSFCIGYCQSYGACDEHCIIHFGSS